MFLALPTHLGTSLELVLRGAVFIRGRLEMAPWELSGGTCPSPAVGLLALSCEGVLSFALARHCGFLHCSACEGLSLQAWWAAPEVLEPLWQCLRQAPSFLCIPPLVLRKGFQQKKEKRHMLLSGGCDLRNVSVVILSLFCRHVVLAEARMVLVHHMVNEM